MVNWRWRSYWIIVALAVAIGESVAAFNGGTGDTISEHVWWLLNLGHPAWLAGLGAFSGGFAILVWHFFFDKRRPQ